MTYCKGTSCRIKTKPDRWNRYRDGGRADVAGVATPGYGGTPNALDSLGNILSGTGQPTRTYNSQNEINGLTYDNNGNLTRDDQGHTLGPSKTTLNLPES